MNSRVIWFGLALLVVLSLLVVQCTPAPPAPPLPALSPAPTNTPTTSPIHPDGTPTQPSGPPTNTPTSTPVFSPSPPVVPVDPPDWITYRNEALGFEFKYPEKLNLIESESEVVLNHSIDYENYGDCDMLGGNQLYQTLDDFNVSFEVIHNHVDHDLYGYDYTYKAGLLEGYWIYEGAQGCGNIVYYFPAGEDKTLVVTRAAVQALSGISLIWDLEEILQVPGVIPKEEAEEIFDQILATFKFIED